MGVWIETRIKHRQIADRYVTPCMGVWIETSFIYSSSKKSFRHTLYGCVD